MKEFEEEEDGFTVDFDVLGFMRDQDKYQRIRSTGVLNFTDEDVSISSNAIIYDIHICSYRDSNISSYNIICVYVYRKSTMKVCKPKAWPVDLHTKQYRNTAVYVTYIKFYV